MCLARQRWAGQRLDDERALAGTALDQARMLQLAIGLEHCIRVDGQRADHLLDGRKLIADLEHTEAKGVSHLLNELQIGGKPGARVETKGNHLLSTSPKYLAR